jgi:hypothetical protein
MKMNDDDRPGVQGEHRDLVALIEQGRQLHSKAVFEMCANLFKRTKISKAMFKIEDRSQSLVGSHQETT